MHILKSHFGCKGGNEVFPFRAEGITIVQGTPRVGDVQPAQELQFKRDVVELSAATKSRPCAK